MPGLYGFFGSDANLGRLLRMRFEKSHPNAATIVSPDGTVAIGAHSHSAKKSVDRKAPFWYAVDGEQSMYNHSSEGLPGSHRPWLIACGATKAISPDCKGNVLLYDDDTAVVHVMRDWSSCFPTYFTKYKNNFMVSSSILPLAQAINAEVDWTGMVEYMLSGYCVGSRTQFVNISRLCPGQLLSYSMEKGDYAIQETSRLWSRQMLDREFEDVVANMAGHLSAFWERHYVTDADRIGIMLSAGWDSRLALATLLSSKNKRDCLAVTYENSAKTSRETTIVQEISRELGLNFRPEKAILDPSNIEFLCKVFTGTETCCFPEWYYIGDVFHSAGVERITCGILGEVLGGHYGLGFIGNFFQKAFNFLSTYIKAGDDALSLHQAEEILVKLHATIPWYVKGDSDFRHKDVLDEIDSDVRQSVHRYRNRGIESGNRLLEAFITEHRGMGHIAEQALSARGKVDIVLPFADRPIMEEATSIPMNHRIHNRLTKALIDRLCPELLNFPTAAILVPAKYPLLVQEFSRAVRILGDATATQLLTRTKGRLALSATSYRDCEYLRQGDQLAKILDYISLECLDKRAFRRRIEALKYYKETTPPWFFFWQLMKLLTLDFMYRGKQ